MGPGLAGMGIALGGRAGAGAGPMLLLYARAGTAGGGLVTAGGAAGVTARALGGGTPRAGGATGVARGGGPGGGRAMVKDETGSTG